MYKQCVFAFQDFRNYQYTLPMVAGLVVDMEVRKTSIKIPSNRYNEVGVQSQKHGIVLDWMNKEFNCLRKADCGDF